MVSATEQTRNRKEELLKARTRGDAGKPSPPRSILPYFGSLFESKVGFWVLTTIVAGLMTSVVAYYQNWSRSGVKDLSSGGIAYARAASSSIAAAIDASIDADSTVSIITRSRPGNAPPPPVLEKRLAELNAELTRSTTTWYLILDNLATLEQYFVTLQEVSDHPESLTAREALGRLAGRISATNRTISPNRKSLPNRESQPANMVSGMVKRVHQSVATEALKRDAPILDEAMEVSSQVLALADDDIREHLQKLLIQLYSTRVRQPYIAQEMDEVWVKQRRQLIRASALLNSSDQLRSAETAQGKAQGVWSALASGDFHPSEGRLIQRRLEEIQGLQTMLRAP